MTNMMTIGSQLSLRIAQKKKKICRMSGSKSMKIFIQIVYEFW